MLEVFRVICPWLLTRPAVIGPRSADIKQTLKVEMLKWHLVFGVLSRSEIGEACWNSPDILTFGNGRKSPRQATTTGLVLA